MYANTLVVAHAGHWAAGLLYLAPVVIVVGALGWQSYKDHRDERDENARGDRPEAGPRRRLAQGLTWSLMSCTPASSSSTSKMPSMSALKT